MAQPWQRHGSGQKIRYDTLRLTIYNLIAVAALDPAMVGWACRAPSALRTVPFELCFARLVTLGGGPNNRALVFATDESDRSADDISTDLHPMLRLGGRKAMRAPKVYPPVTAAYGPPFEGTRFLDPPIRWTIPEIELIDCHYCQGRHVRLGRWPLPEGRQQASFDL